MITIGEKRWRDTHVEAGRCAGEDGERVQKADHTESETGTDVRESFLDVAIDLVTRHESDHEGHGWEEKDRRAGDGSNLRRNG